MGALTPLPDRGTKGAVSDEAVLAHVVLVAPEIPWNTGNAGRSCLALGARLCLVGPLGFALDEKSVRRAGLDYWKYVNPAVYDDWTQFEAQGLTRFIDGDPWIVSPDGQHEPWSVDLGPSPVLIFGSESRGLPTHLRERFRDRSLRIPMRSGPIRSINVSTTVGILLAEVQRQRSTRPPPLDE